MIVLGLTGGIGTGKSTASEYLKGKGATHIDADKIGWEITEKGSPLLPILEEKFGGVLNEDGSLNRKALAAKVFSDREKREELNDLMFQIIIDEIENRIKKLKHDDNNKILLVDAPLLFESGADKLCDKVMLVTADLDVRLKRVCERDGTTEGEVLQRVKAQMKDEDKAVLSDFIVDNSFDLEDLHEKLDEIFLKIGVDI